MSERKKFGAAEAIQALRDVVAEKGADFRYSNPEWTKSDLENNTTRCLNFHGKEPGCIVGHVLHRLGVTSERASVLGVQGSASAYDACVQLNVEDFEWTFTSGAWCVLTEAQAHQDNRHPWGEALAKAEHYFDGLPAGL